MVTGPGKSGIEGLPTSDFIQGKTPKPLVPGGADPDVMERLRAPHLYGPMSEPGLAGVSQPETATEPYMSKMFELGDASQEAAAARQNLRALAAEPDYEQLFSGYREPPAQTVGAPPPAPPAHATGLMDPDFPYFEEPMVERPRKKARDPFKERVTDRVALERQKKKEVEARVSQLKSFIQDSVSRETGSPALDAVVDFAARVQAHLVPPEDEALVGELDDYRKALAFADTDLEVEINDIRARTDLTERQKRELIKQARSGHRDLVSRLAPRKGEEFVQHWLSEFDKGREEPYMSKMFELGEAGDKKGQERLTQDEYAKRDKRAARLRTISENLDNRPFVEQERDKLLKGFEKEREALAKDLEGRLRPVAKQVLLESPTQYFDLWGTTSPDKLKFQINPNGSFGLVAPKAKSTITVDQIREVMATPGKYADGTSDPKHSRYVMEGGTIAFPGDPSRGLRNSPDGSPVLEEATSLFGFGKIGARRLAEGGRVVMTLKGSDLPVRVRLIPGKDNDYFIIEDWGDNAKDSEDEENKLVYQYATTESRLKKQDLKYMLSANKLLPYAKLMDAGYRKGILHVIDPGTMTGTSLGLPANPAPAAEDEHTQEGYLGLLKDELKGKVEALLRSVNPINQEGYVNAWKGQAAGAGIDPEAVDLEMHPFVLSPDLPPWHYAMAFFVAGYDLTEASFGDPGAPEDKKKAALFRKAQELWIRGNLPTDEGLKVLQKIITDMRGGEDVVPIEEIEAIWMADLPKYQAQAKKMLVDTLLPVEKRYGIPATLAPSSAGADNMADLLYASVAVPWSVWIRLPEEERWVDSRGRRIWPISDKMYGEVSDLPEDNKVFQDAVDLFGIRNIDRLINPAYHSLVTLENYWARLPYNRHATDKALRSRLFRIQKSTPVQREAVVSALAVASTIANDGSRSTSKGAATSMDVATSLFRNMTRLGKDIDTTGLNLAQALAARKVASGQHYLDVAEAVGDAHSKLYADRTWKEFALDQFNSATDVFHGAVHLVLSGAEIVIEDTPHLLVGGGLELSTWAFADDPDEGLDVGIQTDERGRVLITGRDAQRYLRRRVTPRGASKMYRIGKAIRKEGSGALAGKLRALVEFPEAMAHHFSEYLISPVAKVKYGIEYDNAGMLLDFLVLHGAGKALSGLNARGFGRRADGKWGEVEIMPARPDRPGRILEREKARAPEIIDITPAAPRPAAKGLEDLRQTSIPESRTVIDVTSKGADILPEVRAKAPKAADGFAEKLDRAITYGDESGLILRQFVHESERGGPVITKLIQSHEGGIRVLEVENASRSHRAIDMAAAQLGIGGLQGRGGGIRPITTVELLERSWENYAPKIVGKEGRHQINIITRDPKTRKPKGKPRLVEVDIAETAMAIESVINKASDGGLSLAQVIETAATGDMFLHADDFYVIVKDHGGVSGNEYVRLNLEGLNVLRPVDLPGKLLKRKDVKFSERYVDKAKGYALTEPFRKFLAEKKTDATDILSFVGEQMQTHDTFVAGGLERHSVQLFDLGEKGTVMKGDYIALMDDQAAAQALRLVRTMALTDTSLASVLPGGENAIVFPLLRAHVEINTELKLLEFNLQMKAREEKWPLSELEGKMRALREEHGAAPSQLELYSKPLYRPPGQAKPTAERLAGETSTERVWRTSDIVEVDLLDLGILEEVGNGVYRLTPRAMKIFVDGTPELVSRNLEVMDRGDIISTLRNFSDITATMDDSRFVTPVETPFKLGEKPKVAARAVQAYEVEIGAGQTGFPRPGYSSEVLSLSKVLENLRIDGTAAYSNIVRAEYARDLIPGSVIRETVNSVRNVADVDLKKPRLVTVREADSHYLLYKEDGSIVTAKDLRLAFSEKVKSLQSIQKMVGGTLGKKGTTDLFPPADADLASITPEMIHARAKLAKGEKRRVIIDAKALIGRNDLIEAVQKEKLRVYKVGFKAENHLPATHPALLVKAKPTRKAIMEAVAPDLTGYDLRSHPLGEMMYSSAENVPRIRKMIDQLYQGQVLGANLWEQGRKDKTNYGEFNAKAAEKQTKMRQERYAKNPTAAVTDAFRSLSQMEATGLTYLMRTGHVPPIALGGKKMPSGATEMVEAWERAGFVDIGPGGAPLLNEFGVLGSLLNMDISAKFYETAFARALFDRTAIRTGPLQDLMDFKQFLPEEYAAIGEVATSLYNNTHAMLGSALSDLIHIGVYDTDAVFRNAMTHYSLKFQSLFQKEAAMTDLIEVMRRTGGDRTKSIMKKRYTAGMTMKEILTLSQTAGLPLMALTPFEANVHSVIQAKYSMALDATIHQLRLDGMIQAGEKTRRIVGTGPNRKMVTEWISPGEDFIPLDGDKLIGRTISKDAAETKIQKIMDRRPEAPTLPTVDDTKAYVEWFEKTSQYTEEFNQWSHDLARAEAEMAEAGLSEAPIKQYLRDKVGEQWFIRRAQAEVLGLEADIKFHLWSSRRSRRYNAAMLAPKLVDAALGIALRRGAQVGDWLRGGKGFIPRMQSVFKVNKLMRGAAGPIARNVITNVVQLWMHYPEYAADPSFWRYFAEYDDFIENGPDPSNAFHMMVVEHSIVQHGVMREAGLGEIPSVAGARHQRIINAAFNRSKMSKVLSGEVNMTADHAVRLAEALAAGEVELVMDLMPSTMTVDQVAEMFPAVEGQSPEMTRKIIEGLVEHAKSPKGKAQRLKAIAVSLTKELLPRDASLESILDGNVHIKDIPKEVIEYLTDPYAEAPKGFSARDIVNYGTRWITELFDKNARIGTDKVTARAAKAFTKTDDGFKFALSGKLWDKGVRDGFENKKKVGETYVSYQNIKPVERAYTVFAPFGVWLTRSAGIFGRFIKRHPLRARALMMVHDHYTADMMEDPDNLMAWMMLPWEKARSAHLTSMGWLDGSAANIFGPYAEQRAFLNNPALQIPWEVAKTIYGGGVPFYSDDPLSWTNKHALAIGQLIDQNITGGYTYNLYSSALNTANNLIRYSGDNELGFDGVMDAIVQGQTGGRMIESLKRDPWGKTAEKVTRSLLGTSLLHPDPEANKARLERLNEALLAAARRVEADPVGQAQARRTKKMSTSDAEQVEVKNQARTDALRAAMATSQWIQRQGIMRNAPYIFALVEDQLKENMSEYLREYHVPERVEKMIRYKFAGKETHDVLRAWYDYYWSEAYKEGIKIHDEQMKKANKNKGMELDKPPASEGTDVLYPYDEPLLQQIDGLYGREPLD